MMMMMKKETEGGGMMASVVVVVVVVVVFMAVVAVANGEVVDFERSGGIPNNGTLATCVHNAKVLNATLQALQPHDTLHFGNTTFWLMGGIVASNLRDIVVNVDGTLAYIDDQKAWPRDPDGSVHDCLTLHSCVNVTFTSSQGMGTMNGNGAGWWGAVKYLEIGENRPKLLRITNTSQILLEHILFKNSPYYNVDLSDVRDVIIRYCDVDARRDNATRHDLYDLTAFNTDGFDVAGKNVHIHDCNIWNDDDCVAVKEQTGASLQSTCSENYLIERVRASGVGLTIGSIGASDAHTCVRNITFRDCIMMDTFKGIYMKSRPSGTETSTGEITNVLYKNITIVHPTQWAIWIGPQQAGYKGACSLLWPWDSRSKCPVPNNMVWTNITLEDITITGPNLSPGVILGNVTTPMRNIVFDNVKVESPGLLPWGRDYYKCVGVKNGQASGDTSPKPPCFSQSLQLN